MGNLAERLALREYEGYIQVIRIVDGKIIKKGNYKYSELYKLEELANTTDVYFTPNSNYNGKRGLGNLKQLRSLYVDFDIRGKEIDKNALNHIIYEAWLLADAREIPTPTKALASGRGVHIYWDLEPSSYGALSTWQELEDFLYNKLKHLGADRQATDAARLMRLEGTINSKSGTKCEMYALEKENVYSMYDLREDYLNWSSKHKNINVVKKEKTNKRNIINIFNSYTLHLARAEDIETLCKIRNYEVDGHRNFIIHCYAYWKGIYIRDKEELKEKVYELNNRFKKPLRASEVDSILRCIPKAIDKFLEYEQGIRSGELKRVSKGMRDKGGYWYKNETLIERLNISTEEQRSLKTIIGTEVKYERNNKIRTPRNENGLTKKQQELKDLKEKIIELKNKRLSNRQIAQILKISEGKVRSIVKKQ